MNHRDGDEDVGKKRPSGIPRAHNGPGRISSDDAKKWGNDIDFAPNNDDLPDGWSGGTVASGGNWDKNGIMNREWSKNSGRKWGQSGDNGPGDYSTSGWVGTRNGDSGGDDGVWHASGNNAGRCGSRAGGGRDHGPGPGHGCGRSSSWGGNKESQSSGGSFDRNEGVWQASGNNVGARGCRGGGRGRGRSGSPSWGGSSNSFDGAERVWHATGNNLGGNGHRGGGRGCSGWGGTKESENNDRVWNSTGNNVGGRGRSSGERDHGPGRGYGSRTGNWDSHRGDCRGSGCGYSRGRGRGNERADNSHKESEYGPKSFNWDCNNEDTKRSHDKITNFPGDTTYGSWGHKNVTNDRVKSNGNRWNSWNSNGGAYAGGGSWERSEAAATDHNGGNGDSSSWGVHVLANQGGWGSGSQRIMNTGRWVVSANSHNHGAGGGNGGW